MLVHLSTYMYLRLYEGLQAHQCNYIIVNISDELQANEFIFMWVFEMILGIVDMLVHLCAYGYLRSFENLSVT
jgi:hypothetical protein